MQHHASPREIVDRQLLAYNARDLDAYCALFAQDARLSRLDSGLDTARGIDAIRAVYTTRFGNHPDLNCKVKSRIELGDFVIDHEQVRGITEGLLEVVAIYEVRESLIRSVRFIWPGS